MVKRLVVKTSNPETLFEHMHEKGTSFYTVRLEGPADNPKQIYNVIYFASNREVHFEGELIQPQVEKLKMESTRVKSILIDEFAGEIIIEE